LTVCVGKGLIDTGMY